MMIDFGVIGSDSWIDVGRNMNEGQGSMGTTLESHLKRDLFWIKQDEKNDNYSTIIKYHILFV